MKKSFLHNTSEPPAIRRSSTTTSNREAVKILIMGSPKGVTNTIQTLYRLGFRIRPSHRMEPLATHS